MLERLIALSPVTFWGLSAGVPAVLAEYLYRIFARNGFPWWYGLPVWVPMQLLIGYSIFRLVTVPNTTLLDAFVVWALSTTLLRVFASVVLLQDNVQSGTWFALGLLIMARIAQSFWGR